MTKTNKKRSREGGLPFREQLNNKAKKHGRLAKIFNALVATLFYASMIFGGLAVAAGVIKSANVPSEYISLFAAIATAATFMSREWNSEQKPIGFIPSKTQHFS